MAPTSTEKPTVVYVINAFDGGGAEAGLIALVEGALFKGCKLLVVSLVRGEGGLEAKLAALGHAPHILADRTRMRVTDLPRLFLLLRRFFLEQQPDAVIASLPQANILARVCLFFRRRVLFISFEHNTHLAKRIYELAYRLTSMRVDWMFADAAATLEVAARRLYRNVPQRRTVVPLLSFPSATKTSDRPAPSGPFHIVNAARFTLTKNQSALIEAVAMLIHEGRDLTLALYGEGPERQACRELASRLGIESRVLFPGFVECWAELPADLFVLVSKNEGLCLAVLEAMHAGIPVAAAIVGGMADYADRTVLKPLDSTDPSAVAGCIASLMDDLPALSAQAARASTLIDRRFGANVVRGTYDQINQLLIESIGERADTPRGAPLLVRDP
jgi:glycosyltransferase involved in cell wall biosynthesis